MKIPILVLLTLCYAESYRILVVYPFAVKSLNILGQGIVRHLLNDGNEVTYITTHPMRKHPSKKLRQIDVSSNIKLFEHDEKVSIAYILKHKMKENEVQHILQMTTDNTRMTYENENVTKLLENTNERFDAVIVDYLESETYAGLSVLYNCPMIWMNSMGAQWHVVRLIADPGNPSYDPHYMGTNIPPFTFMQRVEELWERLKWFYFKTFYAIPKERDIYQQVFGPLVAKQGRKLPDYDDVIYNASMIFGNEHDAIIHRPSTPQNFKYIGGFHIEDNVIPLSKDLQDLMDNAPHGVIYFSMGSFWKSRELPMDLTRAILNVFGQLKQTVIWKYEENLDNVPKNVHIVHWAPQQSILAHKNCKFFISHGGLLSSIESVHFGVPVIGIPVLYDQFTNINKAVANGYAIRVDLNYDLPKNLKAAIDVMLTDDRYRKNMEKLTFIYHHRLSKPGVEMAHWVRHVIETGGARHLRSPGFYVPLYQRMYLDLLAIILGIIFIIYNSCISNKGSKRFAKKKKH